MNSRPVLALFDLDRTLLRKSSGVLYMRYLWRGGNVRARVLVHSSWIAILYALGVLDYPHATMRLTRVAAGGREEGTRDLWRSWFREVGVSHVAPGAKTRIQEHRASGHEVAIISASMPYAVEPVAGYLGVEDYACTRPLVEGGRFTGAMLEPPCFGPGKLVWARRLASRHGARLEDAYFYSDGYSDRMLLQAVGHPVAVNPDRRLARLAHMRGWPVERFY